MPREAAVPLLPVLCYYSERVWGEGANPKPVATLGT